MKVYKCDQCKTEIDTDSNYIQMGSDNNSFYFSLKINGESMIVMSKYSSLDFCSSKCFKDFFLAQQ